MNRVAINGTLSKDVATEFADCHPVIPACFERHFTKNAWAPTPLLAFLTESGLLKTFKVREAIIAFEKQTEVWLAEDRNQWCSIIGKFTLGSNANEKN